MVTLTLEEIKSRTYTNIKLFIRSNQNEKASNRSVVYTAFKSLTSAVSRQSKAAAARLLGGSLKLSPETASTISLVDLQKISADTGNEMRPNQMQLQ